LNKELEEVNTLMKEGGREGDRGKTGGSFRMPTYTNSQSSFLSFILLSIGTVLAILGHHVPGRI
jgi:hypothetical protein